MERADHFSAQDRARRRRQKLRDPGGAAGRFAKGDSRSGQRNSGAPRKSERCGGGRKNEAQGIQQEHAASGQAAARSIMRWTVLFLPLGTSSLAQPPESTPPPPID